MFKHTNLSRFKSNLLNYYYIFLGIIFLIIDVVIFSINKTVQPSGYYFWELQNILYTYSFYGCHFETDEIVLQFRHRINICTVHFYAEFDVDIILSSELYAFSLLKHIQTDTYMTYPYSNYFNILFWCPEFISRILWVTVHTVYEAFW